MKGGKKTPLGYTIVEVMVVLAVSGVMFLLAASFINGRQEQTAFTEGVNDMASSLQNIIEQVESGQYSDIKLPNCVFGANLRLSFSGSNTAQGNNSNCVFLGKLLYLSYDDAAGTSSNYEILSLAGGRIDSTGKLITTPKAAGATVVAPLTIQTTTTQNLTIQKATVIDTSVSSLPRQTYGIGFLQSPSVDFSNALANGSDNIALYYVPNLGAGLGSAVDSHINSGGGSGGNVRTAQHMDICLTDGLRYAEILLGTGTGSTSQSNLDITVKVDGTTKPATVC